MIRRRSRQQGLSMVEVLAAMVIFGAAAAVLFGWIAQVADRLAKLGQEQGQLFASLAAVEYLKTVNPMLEPSGSVVLEGGARLRWAAVAVGPEERVHPSSSGLYDVGLYKVEFAVAAGSSERQDSVYLAGSRQVRDDATVNPFGSPQP